MSRVVVVTGGTSGVGRDVARAFADRGDAVAVLARGEDGPRATEEELRGLGVRALAIACDVVDPQQVDDAAARVEQELGPIDVWINNAWPPAPPRLRCSVPVPLTVPEARTALGALRSRR